jgi:environmental stress-induced protein Ves
MTLLIPFAGLATVPWKNGGGTTTEIAIEPPDAGADDFAWRISLATISEDGQFSIYPGVDRTLALVDGHGATLDIDGIHQVVVSEDEPIVSFRGESLVRATVHRGPTTDFNVMTRRARCHHQFGKRRIEGDAAFAAHGDIAILFLAEGDSLSVSSDAERIGMVRLDAVVLQPDTLWTLETAQGVVFIVDIFFD